jgi:adenosylmethionine-8-amino-7-oxononanoate aminotransferase
MSESSHVLYPDPARGYPLAARAQGCYIYDTEGRAYFDGCSSAIAVNLGHGVPEVLAAIHQQLDEITFCYRTQFSNPPAERLAGLLASLAPGQLNHVQFTNSGSEAVEAAVRLAVQYWAEVGRPDKRIVLSRRLSYHGSTLGGLALSGHQARRRQMEPLLATLPLQPLVAEAHCHRCPFQLTPDSCALECAGSLEAELARLGPDNVAAFVVEPVVGASGGAIPAPAGYLRRVADLCRRYDILLIADEVMTGLGRTGTWFGCDREGVAPDLLVVGKGMSAGYLPIGGVLVADRIQQAIRDGGNGCGLGHTFSANPLAAAAALAVVEYLCRHDVPRLANAAGTLLRQGLCEVVSTRGLAVDVRGEGLLLAVDFTPPRTPGAADCGITAAAMVAAAFARGLLLYPAGTDPVPRTVIVAPPLTATDHDIERLLELFAAALDDLGAGDRHDGGALP